MCGARKDTTRDPNVGSNRSSRAGVIEPWGDEYLHVVEWVHSRSLGGVRHFRLASAHHAIGS